MVDRIRRAGQRAVTAMAVAGVTVLTGLGWVLSYTALHQLCFSAGMAFWAATLWPLCIDVAFRFGVIDRTSADAEAPSSSTDLGRGQLTGTR
jgi:hypothetical protein